MIKYTKKGNLRIDIKDLVKSEEFKLKIDKYSSSMTVQQINNIQPD